MQQRLGRNAADVQTNATERFVTLDQDHLHAKIGRAERGGIAARPRAEHDNLTVYIAFVFCCQGLGGRLLAAG